MQDVREEPWFGYGRCVVPDMQRRIDAVSALLDGGYENVEVRRVGSVFRQIWPDHEPDSHVARMDETEDPLQRIEIFRRGLESPRRRRARLLDFRRRNRRRVPPVLIGVAQIVQRAQIELAIETEEIEDASGARTSRMIFRVQPRQPRR